MKLQFKEQNFQIQAVKAVVDCFEEQPLITNMDFENIELNVNKLLFVCVHT